jgi:hypothetical protein
MNAASVDAPATSPPGNKDWSPSLWMGCDALAWARLLADHGFAVQPFRWPVAAAVSVASAVHSLLAVVQGLTHPGAASGRIHPRPVFILGHWRSGTTLLHELLACDPRHAFPTTYECFSPHDFLFTESWLPGRLGRLLPRHRPMDNMAVGWDRPQEDEFALCLLGQPSPYRRIAFPNRAAGVASVMDVANLSPSQRRRWKAAFRGFLQRVSHANAGRRLILKSPPHMCRIPTLLQMFPEARFVHIIRNPYDLYPSTLHLWRTLFAAYGLQRPAWTDLQEHILATLTFMYDRFESGKRQIPTGRLQEMRYEDLVRDPLGRLSALYRGLQLGEFAVAKPHVDKYLAAVMDYRTNRYVLTPVECKLIGQRWGDVIRRYGYAGGC